MSKLLHTITRRVSVGIYDNCADVARVCDDRTVATICSVKWVGNTGGYHEGKHRIDGTAHEAIKDALEDDCEDTAWEVIDGKPVTRPPGRPAEMQDGRPRRLYIADADWERLTVLGDGNASKGIRIALDKSAI